MSSLDKSDLEALRKVIKEEVSTAVEASEKRTDKAISESEKRIIKETRKIAREEAAEVFRIGVERLIVPQFEEQGEQIAELKEGQRNIMTAIDRVMGDNIDIKDEQDTVSNVINRNDLAVKDHEVRIVRLEKKLA